MSARGIVLALLVVILAGVCVRLGFWQLDRLQQKRARNAAARHALAAPTLVLEGDSLAAFLDDPGRYLGRRVEVSGRYDPAGEVVLRGRALEGRPGVEIVTPLRIAGSDAAVMVGRGWVAAPDAATVDPEPHAEPGVRRVLGVVQPFPDSTAGAFPLETTANGARVTTYQRLQEPVLRERVPYRLAGAWIQQLPGPAAPASAPQRVPLPSLDEGPHLGYAIQWFSFAVIAVVGFAVVAFRRSRGHR